jgi:hypothetical protein
MNPATKYDALVRLVAALPPDQVPAAGLGWSLRDADLELERACELGRAGDAVMAGGLPELRWTSHAEIVKRREVDHEPCRVRCDRCSQCAHAASWARRGYRPYAGVQPERELAAGAR